MDLSLSEYQQQLKNTARDFMDRECPKETLLDLDESETGYSDDIWQKASEIGWLGMLVPAEYGGAGGSLTDAAVVYEQLGSGPLSGPFYSSGVLGALIVEESGSDEQKQRFLPGIASGQEIFALAFTEPSYGWGPGSIQMRAERTNGGYTLSGTKLFVHDAVAASRLICPVRTGESDDPADGVTLLVVDSSAEGVTSRKLSGFMGWVGEVDFEGVRVSESAILGEAGGGWAPLRRAFRRAAPVLCAYKVGGSQAVFDMSVEYSRTRRQFGTPIGRFQRVQDHIIGIVNHLDAARWTTFEALWKLDSGRPADTSVHMAKAVSSEAYMQACNGAHEVHAGLGVMREYGLTLHTRMSRTLYHMLGDPLHHRRLMVDSLDI